MNIQSVGGNIKDSNISQGNYNTQNVAKNDNWWSGLLKPQVIIPLAIILTVVIIVAIIKLNYASFRGLNLWFK